MTTCAYVRNGFLRFFLAGLSVLFLLMHTHAKGAESKRPRAREAGVIVGTFPTGSLNAITDVPGVRVGHCTVRDGDSVCTGVTAILPHDGNCFEQRVPAAIYVGNGFGKLIGATQVRELGELESPILLTSTLSVWRVADALTTWMIEQPGMGEVRSLNPVVGETNDGYLNDIRARPIRSEHVIQALQSATNGPVEEGCVGAGTGTIAFGWKGGLGTSSRRVPGKPDTYTVGVLIQSNFGGDLSINGVPVGRELEKRGQRRASLGSQSPPQATSGDGSIMIVVATDAPLNQRNLERLAARALVGLARTGSNMSNGSGDYAISFSTARECRRERGKPLHQIVELSNDAMSPLFQAVAEATEEAIYNSLFMATTTKGFKGTIEALPLSVLDLIKTAGALNRN